MKYKILISILVIVIIGVAVLYLASAKKDVVSVTPQPSTETTISLKNSPERVTKSAPQEKAFFVDMTGGEVRYISYDQKEYIRLDKNGKELSRKQINFEPFIYEVLINSSGTQALIKADPDASVPTTDNGLDNRLFNWYNLDLTSGAVVKYSSDVHAAIWLDDTNVIAAQNNDKGTEIYTTPAADLAKKENIMTVTKPINALITNPVNSQIPYAYGAGDSEDEGVLYSVDLTAKKVDTVLGNQLDLPRISPKGTYALASEKDGGLTLVRLDKRSEVVTIKTEISPSEAIISDDEKTIALPLIESNASPSILLYDIAKRKYVNKIATDDLAVVKLISMSESALAVTINDYLNIIKL